MKAGLRFGSLHLSCPGGRTLLISLLMLLGVAGGAEAAARSSAARAYLVTPVVSGQAQIAAKLDLLTSLEAQIGPVDCFLVGSSMVLRDIDPEVMAQTYLDRTGKRITCFNFGLSGLNIEGAARLSQILVAHHHPRLIIYGTNFRDFAEQLGFDMDIPWARYQLGQVSAEGWLETSSMSYRYALAYANQADLQTSGQYDQGYTRYGYLASDDVLDLSRPPGQAVTPKQADALAHYQVTAQMRDSLRRLLALKSTDTSLVIVEMPVPQSTLSLLGHPDQDYQEFVTAVGREAQAQDAPFWLTLKANLIPADGWRDYTHMNRAGASVFSRWLGQTLAAWGG